MRNNLRLTRCLVLPALLFATAIACAADKVLHPEKPDRPEKAERVEREKKGVGGGSAFAAAEVLYQSGDYEQALAHYQAFLKAFPTNRRCDHARYTVGFILLKKLDRADEARDAFKDFIQHHGSSPLAHNARFHLAELYEKTGDFEEALNIYRELQEKSPNHSRAKLAQKKIKLLNEQIFASPTPVKKQSRQKREPAPESQRADK